MPSLRPLIWIPLLVFAVAAVGGLGFVSVQALDAWGAFRGFRGHVLDGLGEMTRKVAKIEGRLGAAKETAERLEQARGRLEQSLATASIVSSAAGEALSLFSRARSVVPRK